MKKFSLLVGTIGSTAAWYILSNKKLRTELGRAKNSEETIAILTKHLGRDSEKIGKAVHEWIHSEEVQENLTKAKEFTGKTVDTAKRGLKGLWGKAKDAARKAKKAMEGDEADAE